MPEMLDSWKDAGPVAVVLLARGSTSAVGAQELALLTTRVQEALAGQGHAPLRVQAAFVDRNPPALPEVLDACVAARTVVIVPVMVPDEPPLRRWLYKLAMRWSAAHAGGPRLILAEPLLQAQSLADVLAGTVCQALAQPDVRAVMGDEAWETDPKGWSTVPEHQHHALWCVGPRCAAKGAVQLWPRLVEAVRASPDLKLRVKPLQTSCQHPCNHGPLMIVYPDGVWYGPLADADLGRVLTQHVLHGQVEGALRVHGPTTLAASRFPVFPSGD